MTTTTTQSASKQFFMVSQSLTLIEGETVSTLWAYLVNSYNTFTRRDQLMGGIFYQNKPTIEQRLGYKRKKFDKAIKRLEEMGFVNKEIGKVPGTMTSTLYFDLDFEAFNEWEDAHPHSEEVESRKADFFEGKVDNSTAAILERLKSRRKPTFKSKEEVEATKEERVKPTLVKKEVAVTETPDEVENFDDMDYTEMVPYVLNYINLCKGTNNKASKLDTERIIEGLEYYGGWSSTGDMNDGLQVQIDARMERTSTQGTSYYVVSNDNRRQ